MVEASSVLKDEHVLRTYYSIVRALYLAVCFYVNFRHSTPVEWILRLSLYCTMYIAFLSTYVLSQHFQCLLFLHVTAWRYPFITPITLWCSFLVKNLLLSITRVVLYSTRTVCAQKLVATNSSPCTGTRLLLRPQLTFQKLFPFACFDVLRP